MKRTFFFLICFAMLFSLVSCSASLTSPLPTTEEKKSEDVKTKVSYTPSVKQDPISEEVQGDFDPTGFCVGFGRYKITPGSGAPMAGFGNSSVRLSGKVLDDVYVTCVAVRDEEGSTALFFSVDVCSIPGSVWKKICESIETELGISTEFVFLTATHTHSGPEIGPENEGGSILMPRALKAAKDAIATLDRATMYIGQTRTEDMSYVRRYLKADGTPIYRSKLPSNAAQPDYRHETDPDNQMLLIKFDRANQKDVVMMNWACHVTTVGSSTGTEISADWVGSLRDTVESTQDVYFSYYQAAGGNTTPGTRLVGEKNNAQDHIQHGKDLAVYVSNALLNMTEVQTGKVRAIASEISIVYETDTQGFSEEALAAAQTISSLYSSGQYGKIDPLCAQYGFVSAHHAKSILARSKRTPGQTNTMNLGAIAIGDIAFCYAPYEMLSTTGIQIKEASSFDFTFVCGYTNGSYGYIPNKEAFPNRQYEVDSCKYVCGTAEQIAGELDRLLGELNTQG